MKSKARRVIRRLRTEPSGRIGRREPVILPVCAAINHPHYRLDKPAGTPLKTLWKGSN
jgi:hypothetical protein